MGLTEAEGVLAARVILGTTPEDRALALGQFVEKVAKRVAREMVDEKLSGNGRNK